MYAHYQQHQNQNNQYNKNAATIPSSPAVGSTQWNGTSWVQVNPSINTKPQQQQLVPPDPVNKFTQYYHEWSKRETTLKNSARACRNDDERQKALRESQWAKYYAEESSRAAHHFHQNPQSTFAPFELPPAPPAADSVNYNNSKNSNVSQSSSKTAPSNDVRYRNSSSSTSTSSNSSGSITRYVKRNVERPEVKNDPKLKAFVQSKIEEEIASALHKGILNSINWDFVPMISLPLDNNSGKSYKNSSSEPQTNNYNYGNSNTSNNYYGHPAQSETSNNSYGNSSTSGNYYGSSAEPETNKNNYGNSSSSSGKYYGPASSPLASSTSSKKFGGNEVQTSGSYYGPTSSHNNTSVQNSQQINNSNKNNNNSFSSSPFTGKNKNNKRQYQNPQMQEEDFISFGAYGPGSSSSPDSIYSGNKKTKKKQRKNKYNAHLATVTGTGYNIGMDDSQQAMSKRANRFSGRGGIQEANHAKLRSSSGMFGNREHDKYMGKGTIGGRNITLNETDFEKMTVKGTSTTLEKGYLRLTAPPRAEFVRPFDILKQHLHNLRSEYYCCRGCKADRDDRKMRKTIRKRMKSPLANWDIPEIQIRERQHDYQWFCSQLKAIRQDCTVQRIQGDLAVGVYETHGRIALQEGDLNEYNQCQTQLKELYKTRRDVKGKGSVVLDDNIEDSSSVWKHQEEFLAYRLLYYVFLSTNEKYSGGSTDMLNIMLSLTAKERENPAVSHALKVREAIASSDYFWFFRLHKSSPSLGVFLTGLLVPTMRMRGLRRIAKAYRPSIDLSDCLKYLGFLDNIESTSSTGRNDYKTYIEEGKSWLISCGGIIEGSNFVTKDSQIHAPDAEITKNSLI